MSGHSKWANIKRRKGAQDEVRGKIFTKISKEIFVAVRAGGPDPDLNFRLRLVVQKARANNMPVDNIKRAIQKASGANDGAGYDEIVYEGYGPNGVAIMCDILTDNRNRVASEVRYTFSRNNGNLGETGCVGWMFERKGRLTLAMAGLDEEELLLAAIDAGADDFTTEDGEGEIIVEPENMEAVRTAMEGMGVNIEEAEVVLLPKNTVEITDLASAHKLLTLIETLEDNDDIQNVYHNAEFTPEVLEQLENE